MHTRRPILLITMLFAISACTSQPLSPEDEAAMELYRACMEGAPQAWDANDVSHAVTVSGTNSSGAVNTSAQRSRDTRNDENCKKLARERSD